MNYNIETTDDFDKEIKKLNKKYPSLKADFQAILNELKKEFHSLSIWEMVLKKLG